MGRKVSKEEYERIKQIISLCDNNKFVEKVTGRKRATIGRVKRSKDYEDYQLIVSGKKNKAKESKPEQITMDCIGNRTKRNDIADLVSEIATKMCELAAMLNAS